MDLEFQCLSRATHSIETVLVSVISKSCETKESDCKLLFDLLYWTFSHLASVFIILLLAVLESFAGRRCVLREVPRTATAHWIRSNRLSNRFLVFHKEILFSSYTDVCKLQAVWGVGLDGLDMGPWVWFPLMTWPFIFVFLCCTVLCRQTSCSGPTLRPGSLASGFERACMNCKATGKERNNLNRVRDSQVTGSLNTIFRQ